MNKVRVLIKTDYCAKTRKDNIVGKIAVIEGECPRIAIVHYQGQIFSFSYLDFIGSLVTFDNGTPVANIVPYWAVSKHEKIDDDKRPQVTNLTPPEDYWFSVDMARATILDTGEIVFEDECHWEIIE